MPVDAILPGEAWPGGAPPWSVALREEDHSYLVTDWVWDAFALPRGSFEVAHTSRNIVSGTGVKKKYFPQFDADATIAKKFDAWQLPGSRSKYKGMTKEEIKRQWSGNDAAARGTEMHLIFEKYYTWANARKRAGSEETEEQLLDAYALEARPAERGFHDEWRQFRWYVVNVVPHDQMLAPEMTLAAPAHRVCGCADIVAKGSKPNGVRLLDYKRSKHACLPTDFAFGKWNSDDDAERANGYRPCAFMKANKYSEYRVQLNLYKWILQKHYGVEVESMHLVRMYPEATADGRALAGKAAVIPVEDCQDVIEVIMAERLRALRVRRLFRVAVFVALLCPRARPKRARPKRALLAAWDVTTRKKRRIAACC